ncbi:polyphosphate kinase 1 [Psychroflexus sp. MBR-150]|jgi:polyphosphate kinase
MADLPLKHRDIDWLSFNQRFLQEAEDQNNPLYERLKFLAIFSSNLDEFFKVRVSLLRQIKRLDKSQRKKSALKPNKTLKTIQKIIKQQQIQFEHIFFKHIIPQLKINRIELITDSDSIHQIYDQIAHYFKTHIADLITPKIIKSSDKKSVFLKNEELYLFVDFGEEDCFGLVDIPSKLSRFVNIESQDNNFKILVIDDIIKQHCKYLFKHKTFVRAYQIKLSRDTELFVEDEFEGELKEKILESFSKTDINQATRILYDFNIPQQQLKFLKHYFKLTKVDLMPGGRYLNFKDFFDFSDPTQNKNLHNKDLKPIPHKILSSNKDFFTAIKAQDQLVHYPYMSFDILENFVKQAAEDEHVKEIKITLYRIGKTSKLTSSLLKALSKGKKLTVFIETKARFDKQNNFEWGKQLKDYGAQVIYSSPKINIHSKILIVSRQELDKVKQYAYIGTGDFNAKTSKIYCDHGLFTADEKITQELIRVFQVIEGELIIPRVKKLMVSPFNTRKRFDKLILKEIDQAKLSKPAKITAKMNSLEDENIIKLLYKASKNGVKVRLVVRSLCCLIPDLENISENITVTSIIDQFIEHGRIYNFYSGGKDKIFIGSADLMTRNIDRGIEVLTPIYNDNLKQELKDILELQCQDNIKARIIDKDAQNKYVVRHDDMPVIRSQMAIYQYLKQKHDSN